MAQAAPAASTVRKVELSAVSADSARIVLDLSAVPARKVFSIEKTGDKPERIVIDLSATRLAAGVRLPKAAGPVLAVRSGTQPGKTLRVVVELSRKLEPAVSVKGSRLIIDIGAAPRQSAAQVPATPAPPAPPVPVRAAHAPEDTGRDINPGATGALGESIVISKLYGEIDWRSAQYSNTAEWH
jgi:hypothetical protein